MCRSRRELSNEYLLAKIGVDMEENEPCKVCPLSVYVDPDSVVFCFASYYFRSASGCLLSLPVLFSPRTPPKFGGGARIRAKECLRNRSQFSPNIFRIAYSAKTAQHKGGKRREEEVSIARGALRNRTL